MFSFIFLKDLILKMHLIKKKKKAAAARKEAEMWDKWDDDMDDSGEEPNAGEEKK